MSRAYANLGDAYCVKVTEKAILVEIADVVGDRFWFPRSAVRNGDSIDTGDSLTDFEVLEEIADEKGLA
jgi:hypothetical protein